MNVIPQSGFLQMMLRFGGILRFKTFINFTSFNGVFRSTLAGVHEFIIPMCEHIRCKNLLFPALGAGDTFIAFGHSHSSHGRCKRRFVLCALN